MKTHLRIFLPAGCLTVWFSAINGIAAARLPSFDFTQPEVAAQWHAQHDIASLRHDSEGLIVTIRGRDPCFAGPAREYPTNTPLWLVIRLKAEQGGGGQVFYWRSTFEVRLPGGPPMAFGHAEPRLACGRDEAVRWVGIPPEVTEAVRENGEWILRSRFSDPDGAVWRYERRFAPDSPGAVLEGAGLVWPAGAVVRDGLRRRSLSVGEA